MFTIWIDGDGCPREVVRFTMAEGERRGIKVVLVTNVHHETQAPNRLIVDGSSQAADLAIINAMKAGDVVITQDIGLAAMVLGKKGAALNPSGEEYRSESMPLILEMRESAAKHRRGGGRTRGPKKRTAEDEAHYQQALRAVLVRLLS
ncbi:MAG: YaiI/YqxD family protein [Tumebacillaceae bacterium]